MPNHLNVRSRLNWIKKVPRLLRFYPHTIDELKQTLKATQVAGVVDHDTATMMEGVINVSELTVADIMVPRAQMVVLEKNQKIKDILPIVIESAHSRFPVIAENKDNVVGILLAKDLLKFLNTDEPEKLSICASMLRPARFVPETKRLDTLLKEFRSSRDHMAIVVDEYGGVSGVVTIEDVLEEIVGDIEDEFDTETETEIKQVGEHTFLVNATTPIEDFNKFFGTPFSDQELDTIGGLVTQHFGHMPVEGEQMTLGLLEFTVQKADTRRLHNLTVRVLGQSESPTET
ncbi:MAG: CBS domain-containing protein [Gammaproteobacteria bacterium]|nr:CBS domain-containing protein [Gammaproteobacteria bacterium]